MSTPTRLHEQYALVNSKVLVTRTVQQSRELSDNSHSRAWRSPLPMTNTYRSLRQSRLPSPAPCLSDSVVKHKALKAFKTWALIYWWWIHSWGASISPGACPPPLAGAGAVQWDSKSILSYYYSPDGSTCLGGGMRYTDCSLVLVCFNLVFQKKQPNWTTITLKTVKVIFCSSCRLVVILNTEFWEISIMS